MLDINKDYSSFQEGVKRFEAAMTGIPDRVPVVTQMHEFAMKELGIPAKKFYTTPGILAAGTLEVQEKYGIDVPVLDYDVYNIEVEALGQEIKYIEVGAKGGRFALLFCNLGATTPPENVKAAIDAVHGYGSYI